MAHTAQFAAAAALLLLVACAWVPGAQARNLKQSSRTGSASSLDSSSGSGLGSNSSSGAGNGSFTFTFQPRLTIEPELDLTALALEPTASIALTPLALTLQETLNANGVFNPSFTASGEADVTAPSSSLKLQGGDVSTTYTAPTTTTTIMPPASGGGGDGGGIGGGAATVQAASGLRNALQPGNLFNSIAAARNSVAGSALRG